MTKLKLRFLDCGNGKIIQWKYTDPIASNCLILDLWIVPGTNQIKVKTSEGDFPLDYFLTRLPSIP